MSHNYLPVVAEPYLCVCALLEMIIKRKSNKLVTQHEIAEYIGVNVPHDYSGDIKNVRYVKDENLYGIVLNDDGLKPIFDRFALNLTEDFSSINKFQDWEFFENIEKNLSLSNDIIVGFSYGILFSDTTKQQIGHACLIEKVENEEVVIYDPGPENYGFKIINGLNLYSAIKKKKDGLWVIY
jgi:hypothetical protein